VVFLLDCDNTLLDNDRVQEDLKTHLEREFGAASRDHYRAIFEELRAELRYADYLGSERRSPDGRVSSPRAESLPPCSTTGRPALSNHHRTEVAMRTLAKSFALSLFLLLVAGCATQAERAAQLQREVEQMIELYGPGSEQLDYKADTDPWRECVLKLAHRDDRYNRYPISTNCVGHRGFMQCTTF
jgi:hypothetical protein